MNYRSKENYMNNCNNDKNDVNNNNNKIRTIIKLKTN